MTREDLDAIGMPYLFSAWHSGCYGKPEAIFVCIVDDNAGCV